jgi:hypothetical protein
MKRAMFKLGEHFLIRSTTASSSFLIDENVETWKNHDRWEFTFKELTENLSPTPPEEERGTFITVSPLHDTVAESFRLDTTQTLLRERIRQAQLQNMARGLAITHNGVPLQERTLELLTSTELVPAFQEFEIPSSDGQEHVTVKMYAGIGESDPRLGGWYLFCNGRQILGHDQTLLTGWGEGNGRAIPRYHNQFARFRGYAFLDADQASLLPWNTTKTGVDLESPVFKAVRQQMIVMSRPVIDFLNQVAREIKEDDISRDEGPLQVALRDTPSAPIERVTTASTFLGPKPRPIVRKPASGRIQYDKPLDQINKVKRVLKVTTFVAVGERTFDYFFRRECEDG